MVLVELDKIIKSKYIKYIDKTNFPMNFEEYNKKCLSSISKIFYLYFTGISEDYINTMLTNDKIKILFMCMDDNFSLKNIISIIVYHKTISKNKIKYYILAYGIHKKLRMCGYGKYSLDEFVDWIKISTNNNNNNKQQIILLKSIKSSMNFYLSYGFVQSNLLSNKLFYKYEPIDELKSNQEKILEYLIV